MDNSVPAQYVCPITLTMMENPVTINQRHNFEREAIMLWFAKGKRNNPLTNKLLPSLHFHPNQSLKKEIKEYISRTRCEMEIEASPVQMKDFQKQGKDGWVERKLCGTIGEKIVEKNKELEEYKRNFNIWRKNFYQYMDNGHSFVITALAGRCYYGQMKFGRRHGKGICCYADGAKYQGEWFHDYYNGKGVFQTPMGKEQYGEWKLGDLQGIGIYEDEMGYRYEGDLVQGTQSGLGVVYKNGEKYFEGQWKYGLRHGQGIRHMGDSSFDGFWRYGVRHGMGEFVTNSGEKKIQNWFHGELVYETPQQNSPSCT